MTSLRILGLSAIALAIAFNIPFTVLSLIFDYPDILRQPSGEVLNRFHAGGAQLVLTWYAFMACALLLVPFSILLSAKSPLFEGRSGLAYLTMISGSFAGLLQAMGLSRWVFVVPMLAEQHAAAADIPDQLAAIRLTFGMLTQFGGVALGEHLGQIFTCLFIGSVAMAQISATAKREKATAFLGFLSILGIGTGLGEGLAIALRTDGSLFSIATVSGYISFSLWLVLTGVCLFSQHLPLRPQAGEGYSKSTI